MICLIHRSLDYWTEETVDPADLTFTLSSYDSIIVVGWGLFQHLITMRKIKDNVITDVCGFKWMIETSDYVAPEAGIGLYIEPDAIHIMKKSEYSNMFGDYSSFSDEFEELSTNTEEMDEEEEE